MVLMPFSLSASMTRWKPSVSSCSVPGASDLVAVFSMGLVSLVSKVAGRLLVLLVKWLLAEQLTEKFLAVRLNVSRKAEGVIARALLRKLGVARFQRFDDAEMLRERGRGAILPSDRQLPVAAHVQEEIVGEINQHRRFRKRDQRLMEGDIGSR